MRRAPALHRFFRSSSRSSAADASACLRAVTSIETPNSFRPVPSLGSAHRARPLIQRTTPSGSSKRYSISYSPRVSNARLIALSRAARSSGCTRSMVAAKLMRASGLKPNSERPCSVIHKSSAETSQTHIAAFAASAARPIWSRFCWTSACAFFCAARRGFAVCAETAARRSTRPASR